jgi:hypothetical protein
MWIFTSNSFLSVVHKAPAKADELLVRARRKGDIQKLFPKAQVKETIGTDYLYRAVIKRTEVAAVMAQIAMELAYGNFKDSIPAHDKQLHDACHRVWSVMASCQRIRPYHNPNRAPSLFNQFDDFDEFDAMFDQPSQPPKTPTARERTQRRLAKLPAPLRFPDDEDL